jgi:hypothetical protein
VPSLNLGDIFTRNEVEMRFNTKFSEMDKDNRSEDSNVCSENAAMLAL